MVVRLSASLIKDFLSCSQKGYYRINYSEEAVQTDNMIVGTILHETLEKYWNQDLNLALQYVDHLFDKYSAPMKRRDQVKICLNNFFNNYTFLLSGNDEIEKFFDIPYGEDKIVGKFDRICKDNVLIDWKSGSYLPKTIEDDIQFILYFDAYKKLYKEEPHILYISLYRNKVLTYTPNYIYRDELYHKVIPDLLDSIKMGNFSREGLFNNSCNNCQFKDFCWKEISLVK